MKAYYRKIVDKVVHPNLEKKLSLGRRSGSDRRKDESDRRIKTNDLFFVGEKDCRMGNDRRQTGVYEPRQKWFKINRSQSRHFRQDV